jgi:hypothetical protein
VRVAAVFAAAVALLIGAAAVQLSDAQTLSTVAIDVDITGNDARTVGEIQNCGEVAAVGDTLDVDIVIPDPGIDSRGIKAYQYELNYDPGVVRVVAADDNFLLHAGAQSGPTFVPVSDVPPDDDGVFTAGLIDFSENLGVEPEGANETGPGVLARLTMEAVGTGQTDLSMRTVILAAANNASLGVDTVAGAAISVGAACTNPPEPTVIPGGDYDGDTIPDEGTPGAGGIPGLEDTPPAGDGTPSGGPDSGVGAGNGEDGANGAPSASDDDGGLSTLAWIGIIFAIALGVGAGGAGVFYLLNRGRPPGAGG